MDKQSQSSKSSSTNSNRPVATEEKRGITANSDGINTFGASHIISQTVTVSGNTKITGCINSNMATSNGQRHEIESSILNESDNDTLTSSLDCPPCPRNSDDECNMDISLTKSEDVSGTDTVSVFRGTRRVDVSDWEIATTTTSSLAVEQVDSTITIGTTATDLSCSMNSPRNESSIARRDISNPQSIISKFRSSISSSNKTFTMQSLLSETALLQERMRFNAQSLQVNYVSPANDQPASNEIRRQILQELDRKLFDMERSSSTQRAVLFSRLMSTQPAKALALKNKDLRALTDDERELLYSSRLRAEIEWAQIRLQTSQQYRVKLEQMVANDKATLKKIEEDLMLCDSADEMQKKVHALEADLANMPPAEVVAEVIDAHLQAVKNEKELDNQLLDLEIQELRLELELAKVKNKHYREKCALLEKIADTFEANSARVQAFVQQSGSSKA